MKSNTNLEVACSALGGGTRGVKQRAAVLPKLWPVSLERAELAPV